MAWSAPGGRSSPSRDAPSSDAISPDVAMSVLDGTQSVSTQAPPRPSESTTVTSAPSWAATSAASYPPGPPPMMATLVCGWFTSPDSVATASLRAPRHGTRCQVPVTRDAPAS